MVDETDVAIVGGGPAGAALATRLAGLGVSATLLERSPQPKWHACGVFSSPLTARRLVDLGLTARQVEELSRPISALNLHTTGGASCRLEYDRGHARGFDRIRLDEALLGLARGAGADIRTGVVVRSVDLASATGGASRVHVSQTAADRDPEAGVIRARLVVGADGPASLVARIAGVTTRRRWLGKAGITFHRTDPDAAPSSRPMTGKFVFGKGWYVGVAPVPRGRVNVGIVVPASDLAAPLEATVARLLAQFPAPHDRWEGAPLTDSYAAAGTLAHRVMRSAGRGYLLVGDAAGFIDPLTGDGLHRALVSSELAADAITGWLRGDAAALDDYDRHLRARFRNKDIVSWVLQGFLAQPSLLDYAVRRLASRHRQREVLTLVLTDQVPASRGLDPRFLARLLAP